MKIVDDKLRIIDDVPSSAVELSVKEKVNKYLKVVLANLVKPNCTIFSMTFHNFILFTLKFLKKVQRQERIVEEIKLVLKPYYNRKRINKDDYKDILRKCVPKVRTIIKIIIRHFTKR